MNILHIISQSGQPYGSQNRCCDKCGLSVYAIQEAESEFYITKSQSFNKEFAKSVNMVRCCDVGVKPVKIPVVNPRRKVIQISANIS